jgi:hypothetical protein
MQITDGNNSAAKEYHQHRGSRLARTTTARTSCETLCALIPLPIPLPSAILRSWSFCRLSQNCAGRLKYLPRRIGVSAADRPLSAHHVINTGKIQGPRQHISAGSHRFHEFGLQDFSRMNCEHFPRPDHLSLAPSGNRRNPQFSDSSRANRTRSTIPPPPSSPAPLPSAARH